MPDTPGPIEPCPSGICDGQLRRTYVTDDGRVCCAVCQRIIRRERQ